VYSPTPSLPYGQCGVAPFCEKTIFISFFVNPLNPIKEIVLIALSQKPAGFCLHDVGHLCSSVSSVVKKHFFCAEQSQSKTPFNKHEINHLTYVNQK